jgi:hypothetical protein
MDLEAHFVRTVLSKSDELVVRACPGYSVMQGVWGCAAVLDVLCNKMPSAVLF